MQDLLTLARRGVSVTEVLSLNRVVSEYMISPECAKLKSFHPRVRIATDLAADALSIVGSPIHLSKTLMNLVSNSAEAMPAGGTIHISVKNVYMDRAVEGLKSMEEGEYVLLRVADNGIGIAAEDMERIFEPFYTKKKMGRSGTGLGMAVVWSTVKDHCGHIDARSIEGEGTTFDLFFPAHPQASGRQSGQDPSGRLSRRRRIDSGGGRRCGSAPYRHFHPGKTRVCGGVRGQRGRGRCLHGNEFGGPAGAGHDHGAGYGRA